MTGISEGMKGTTNMKDIYISDIRTNQEIITYLIVKQVAVKVGSNKKAYLDLLLADCTGEISAKKWDIDRRLKIIFKEIQKNSPHN